MRNPNHTTPPCACNSKRTPRQVLPTNASQRPVHSAAFSGNAEALREACGAGEAPADFTAFRELVDSFDDKLIAWYGNEAHRDAQPMNLMPVGTLGGFPADDFHRSLDPDTLQFTFEGVSGNLRQMNDVLRKIDADAEKWLRKNNPW